MTLDQFARWIAECWLIAGYSLYIYGWLNLPVLILYASLRTALLRDPRPQWCPTLPTHTALEYFCALIYGLVMPAFYFMSARTRSALGPWWLGSWTNSSVTIALGTIAMAWLALRLIEGALRGSRPQYGPGWPDRIIPAVAVGLCLWFHVSWLVATRSPGQISQSSLGTFFQSWLVQRLYPQFCLLGSTLVYGSALAEAWLGRFTEPVRRRHWVVVLVVIGLITVYMPVWLSIPRTTHAQAMALLSTHRKAIAETAQKTNFDPALLAGIIYVAHTRDHPRWTGDLIEAVGKNMGTSNAVALKSDLLNPSVGLCQMRLSTYAQTRWLSMFQKANPITPPAPNSSEFTQSQDRRAQVAHQLMALQQTGLINDSFHVSLPYSSNGDPYGWNGENVEQHLSLESAATMLILLREQWRQAGFPIDSQPEILATLYNLGYERSRPHAGPRANDFGRRVKAFMSSAECRDLFPAAAPLAESRP